MVDFFPDIEDDILDLILGTSNDTTSTDSLYHCESTCAPILNKSDLEENGSRVPSRETECEDSCLNHNIITSAHEGSIFHHTKCLPSVSHDTESPSNNNKCVPTTLSGMSIPDSILTPNQYVASDRDVTIIDNSLNYRWTPLMDEVTAIQDGLFNQNIPSTISLSFIPDSFVTHKRGLLPSDVIPNLDTLSNQENGPRLPQSISEMQQVACTLNTESLQKNNFCVKKSHSTTIPCTSNHNSSSDTRQSQDSTSNLISSLNTTKSPSLKKEDIVSTTNGSQNQPTHSRSSSKSKQVNDLLPPCHVCGDKASGFHYGVNSCEACKGFFRRSLVKVEKNEAGYKCNGYGNCDIVFGKRKSCSACRYKKCISLGMSKHAIKTGRYTVQKKTQNIKEVKKLEAMAIGASLTNICNLSDMECQYIISRLVIAQRKIDPDFRKIFDKDFSLRKQNQVYEQYLKKKETNSELNFLSSELYAEIYTETGIDLDNREFVFDVYARKGILFIENMMEFFKWIPGINSISLDDQRKLLKASSVDYWFLADHKMMNPDLLVINDFDGPEDLSMHKEELQQWYKKQEYIDDIFDMVRPFQRLELTEEEVGIVRGIAVTSSDRCVLQHPDKVQEIQLKLTECLRWLLVKTTKNPEQRFYKILDRLILLRTLAVVCENLAAEELSWPEVQRYPILVEFMSPP